MQRQISRHTCSELCLRGVSDSALPRLELFVRRSKLSHCFPRGEFYQFGAVNPGIVLHLLIGLKTVSISGAFLSGGAVEKPVWSCFNSGMGTWVLVAAFGESQSTQNVPEHPAGNCAPTARG